jgi:hypothetical protein
MDWHEWHTAYEDPASSLSRRLEAVRSELARILAARSDRATQLVSICAGDGRDTLPVLAAADSEVSAVLVELDAELAGAAGGAADRLGLRDVHIRQADAGVVDTFDGIPRADVFMACGVFGNVTDADLRRTVQTLPQLLAPDALVIWTRGSPSSDPSGYEGEPADMVRDVFAACDFVEDRFIRPDDADFRVGVHRLVGTPTTRVPGATMFRFVR